jgi:hypothetical protein
MSQISDAMPTTRSDILPGYVLSKFDIASYGEVEAELKRQHLAVAAASAEGFSDQLRDKIIGAALAQIAAGAFAWGRAGYDAQCQSLQTLPFLLWINLRIKHPQVTRGEAAALITPENTFILRRAILESMGFTFGGDAPKKDEPTQTTTDPPTGETSSASSAPVAA